MRILYFVYSRQASFKAFAEISRTGFSWVDSLLDEFVKHGENSIGLAVPVLDGSFSRAVKENIILYGLPVKGQGNFFNRLLNRIEHKEPGIDVITPALKAIADFNPDIIQIFGTENPLGGIIKATSKPVVIHFQGSVDVVVRKWFSGISKHELLIYESIRNLLLFIGPYHEYFTFRKRAIRERRFIGNCNFIIGRTDFDRRLLSLVSPDSRYFHCEEFIRSQFFISKWNRKFSKNISFISILKGVTYKGLDVLLETSALLDKYSSYDFEFKICGINENEEIVRILKRKYKRDVNFSTFSFLGKVSADSLVNKLCDSDIFIHPSYIENSSNSICEAMSLGMPVIATNVGGTSSLIQDGTDGVLVQEGDPYSLAAAIIDLINNYDYARLLGKNAREKSKVRHDPELITKKMLDIYEEVISKNYSI